MSTETEAALLDWENESRLVEDDIHVHMADFGRWHWSEVADEGRRLCALMFDEEFDKDSPKDSILQGVAAQSAHGVFAAVAAALGVAAEDLEYAIHVEYLDRQDDVPRPIGADALMRVIEEGRKFHERLALGLEP